MDAKYLKDIRLKFMFNLVVIVCAGLVLLWGIDLYDDPPKTYLSEDGSQQLIVKGETYTLNGEQLEAKSATLFEMFKDFANTNYKSVCLLALSLVLLVTFANRLSNIAPFFIIGKALGRKDTKIGTVNLLPQGSDVSGIIAVRMWDFANMSGKLKSTARKDIWDSEQKEADLEPCIGGWHGIYAMRLGKGNNDWGKVAGLVSLSGTVIGHQDNMLRASKCKILTLITNKRGIAEQLRQNYKCPVYLVSKIDQAIERFTISPDGIYWLTHNNSLISTIKEEV